MEQPKWTDSNKSTQTYEPKSKNLIELIQMSGSLGLISLG